MAQEPAGLTLGATLPPAGFPHGLDALLVLLRRGLKALRLNKLYGLSHDFSLPASSPLLPMIRSVDPVDGLEILIH